jgi:proliferating cell nuclear antigen
MTSELGTGSATLSQQDTGNDNDSVILDVDAPVSLSFASRYLNLFSKAGGISNRVTLHMSSDTPLMVVYKIMGDMGDIKYYLAPKITEE